MTKEEVAAAIYRLLSSDAAPPDVTGQDRVGRYVSGTIGDTHFVLEVKAVEKAKD